MKHVLKRSLALLLLLAMILGMVPATFAQEGQGEGAKTSARGSETVDPTTLQPSSPKTGDTMVETAALYDAIIRVREWLKTNAGNMDKFSPALVANLKNTLIEAAAFYETNNGVEKTDVLQAEIDRWIISLNKAVSDTSMSMEAVDIPVTFYDFRSDGLMFEANGGNYYAYMMQNPGDTPSDIEAKFPGIMGSTLTSAGNGGKTMDLVERELVRGQLVYKEKTIEYIAWLIVRGYCRYFPEDTYGEVNRALYDKVIEISSAAGEDATSESFRTALGSWDSTIAKAEGYNGGYFNYDQVETAFDLAYYIATNMWRPIAQGDIMDKENDLPYNLTVDTYDFLRLVKNEDTGAYEITSNKPLSYVLGKNSTEDADGYMGAIYNPDLTKEQTIDINRMRFIPMGGRPIDARGNLVEDQIVPWQGFDGIPGFEDRTDPSKDQGFHFAMHAKGSFVYRKALNQYFYFLGDDDVYYYVNNQLVMDIGGGHPACDDILYLNDVAKDLGMVDGGVYSFDMFYIERHTRHSNMAFSTNIQIMDTDTFTSERQFNADKNFEEIPAGGKVEVGDTIVYQYELENSRDVPVSDLVFYDERLGVTLSGNVCILDGEPKNAEEGGNEEFDPKNLTLYYRGKNGGNPIVLDGSNAKDYAVLINEIEEAIGRTNEGQYNDFASSYTISGLTGEQIMELLALGLPVNCKLAIRGFQRDAKMVDQPYYSELSTSCQYEKAIIGTDGYYDHRPILLNGSAMVSTMVRPDPVFNANKLRYVVDYGKPLEMKLDKIRECIIVPESVIYRCRPEDLTLVGITDRGTHGQVSMEAPRSLGATEGSNEVYDCSSAFGSFKRESSALYYTPGQFLENVATAYAVFRIHLTYMDPNNNFNNVLQNNGVDVTADYYITVSLEIIPATMMYYEAEDFFGSEITYEELVKGGTVNTTPGTKSDSDLGKGTVTDPTPAQDTHYAEGKAKDYPGNHVLIDFDQDEESAQRYTDKAYYFAQEQINWDDGANWKNGTIANGVIAGSLLETNRDKAMLNLPIRYATFVEAKLRATETSTVKMTLITLKHTGVVEELPLSSLNMDTANADYWFSEDLSNNEVVKAGLNTLVGLKIEGPAGLVADYIFVGPYDLSPANQNAAPYFLEDFEGYESEDALNAVWSAKQSQASCGLTNRYPPIKLVKTDRGTSSLFIEQLALADHCDCNTNHYTNSLYNYFDRVELSIKPNTVHIPLSKAPYFEVAAKGEGTLYCYLDLSNGKTIGAVRVEYLYTTPDDYVLLRIDLTKLDNYDPKAYVTSVRVVQTSNPQYPSNLSVEHIYLGNKANAPSAKLTEGSPYYIFENMAQYTPSNYGTHYVSETDWEFSGILSDGTKVTNAPTLGFHSGKQNYAKLQVSTLSSNGLKEMNFSSKEGLFNIPVMGADYLVLRFAQISTGGTDTRHNIFLTIEQNGKTEEIPIAYNAQIFPDQASLQVDLSGLHRQYWNGTIKGIRLQAVSPGANDIIGLFYVYLGPAACIPQDVSSDWLLPQPPVNSETPVAPSVPSVGFGQNLLATFEQTPYWEYWKLKDNDGFKKGSEPELMADTDDAGNAIKVMHMEFDNPGSAESRFRIEGLDIGGAINPTLDIRMKITDLFKWSGFQGNDPLSFKVELTMSDGSTITLSRPVPEENVGKYIVHSFDLNGILTENGPKLRSLVLHFDAYTSLPQHIYLDYVYVGDSNARPGEASEAYVAEVPNVLLQMEYPSEPLDNPANWFYYPEWPVNDWGSNDVPGNKKPGQPLFIKEDGVGALKFTYTSNSWRSQLEGSVSVGDGIPVRDAQYIEVRLKLSNIQPAMYGSGTPALRAKLLTQNGSLNGETFDAGTVYVKDQYCVISCDWSNLAQITRSTDTLLGLRLFFEPTTDFPLEIYLDYVYVGPKADAPSQSGGIRQSYEEIYGFDSTYTNDRYLSNGESLYIEGKGNRMEPTAGQYEKDPSTANGIVPGTGSYSEFQFSFTGTGFDLISRTGAQQGTVRVSVYTAEQRLKENRIKAITVNNKGELELFQIPVVSVQGLPYATYYVVVGVSDTVSVPTTGVYFGNEFYFDALRIYDPIDTAANEDVLSAYKADGEAYTHVKEIRDTLLDASDFTSLTLGNSMEGAMFVDTSNYITPDPSESTGETVAEADKVIVNDHIAANVSSYNKVGPKNEIYLSPGQAVAFRLEIDSVQMPTSIDIGAKSILGDRAVLSAGFVVGGGNEVLSTLSGTAVTVATSTALYYPVSLGTLPDAESVYLVIYNALSSDNKAKNILSLTDLKVCYDEAPESKLPTDDDLNEPEIHPTRATHKLQGMKNPYRFLVDGRTLEAAAVYMKAHWETPTTDEGVQIMHSLNLASDISINYIVAKTELEGYDSFYLECLQPRYEGNTYVGDTTLKLEPVDKGYFYYFTLDGLTAIQMNDTVQATLHMEKGGKSYCSKVDSYSIARYAYSQLAKETNTAELKTLCADLLRYGAEAQSYKSYRVDCPVDQAMTDSHKTYLSDIEAVTFGNHNAVWEDLAAPAVTWAGKALVLDSRVTVRFVINATGYSGSAEDLELRIRYRDLNGMEQTAVLTEATAYGGTEGIYAFDFAGLSAAELRSVLEATVYAGNTQVSDTQVYSADTYGNNKTGALLDLCKALFAYADSAKAFFA